MCLGSLELRNLVALIPPQAMTLLAETPEAL